MNFEDDLSKDIESALSQTESPATPPAGDAAPPADSGTPPSAEVATPAPAGERSRDDQGRFAEKPKAEEKKPAAQPETAVASQPSATQQAAPQTAQAVAAVPAPPHWKGGGKVEWAKLTPEVQREIVNDYSRVSQTEGELTRLKSAIGDRAQVLAATYGSVEQGIQNLFAISDMANKNPTGFVLWFAQQRGIDLTQFGQGSAAVGQNPQAPESHPLMQKLAAIESQQNALQQHIQQAQNAPIMAEVERFKSDPAHPYYNDVEPHIISLLQQKAVAGNSPSERLKNAYEAAIWARPDIRERLLEGERQKLTDKNAATVAQAKQAAGSITGSPAGSKASADEPDEDLEATIRRTVNRLVPA